MASFGSALRICVNLPLESVVAKGRGGGRLIISIVLGWYVL